jgi:hypothetical protein
MKKLFVISIFLLTLLPVTFAQNYQTVNSGRIVSFQHEGDHGFVRIDSVAFENDSILIPFRSIQQVGYFCYIVDGANWIGEEIILRDDGMNIVLNNEGDSIHINTAATLNDSWTLFNRPGDLSIISTVISHDTMSFLGLQDSVKTMGFEVYDELLNPVNHIINNYTIKLSKNHGFVRTLNFSVFPDLLSGGIPLQFEYIFELDISGLSEPIVGIQDFDWMDINDFQPGDEIHVVSGSAWGGLETDHQKLIMRYLERTDYPDSIEYLAERIHSQSYTLQGNTTYTFIHDTIPEVIHPNPIFDRLAGEVVMDTITYGPDLISYSIRMKTGTRLAKIIPEPNAWLFFYSDTCWSPMVVYADGSDYSYYHGLGGPYYYYSSGWGPNYRTLVYYKKDDEEWGTPLVIVGVDEAKSPHNVKVYPNPARQFTNVQLNEAALPAKIEIFNAMGSLLREFVLTETMQQISLEQLTPGLYLYRIANEKEALGSGKLVVE